MPVLKPWEHLLCQPHSRVKYHIELSAFELSSELVAGLLNDPAGELEVGVGDDGRDVDLEILEDLRPTENSIDDVTQLPTGLERPPADQCCALKSIVGRIRIPRDIGDHRANGSPDVIINERVNQNRAIAVHFTPKRVALQLCQHLLRAITAKSLVVRGVHWRRFPNVVRHRFVVVNSLAERKGISHDEYSFLSRFFCNVDVVPTETIVVNVGHDIIFSADRRNEVKF